MNEFNKFHPTVSFLYFFSVICFSCFFLNPITLFISLVSALSYSVTLNGAKALKVNFLYMLPIVFATAIINPIFNHTGMTVIAYLPNGKPITYESVLYGIASSVMLWSVICHFSSFNKIMTSDKLMYLFAKIAPSISLVFSMVLRFVPRFKNQLKSVSDAQRCIGRDMSQGSFVKRLKNGIKILSAMITWCLENAINTADSMKSRGYGLKNRTSYSNFKFTKRDAFALFCIGALSVCIIIAGALKMLSFEYYPVIDSNEITPCEIFAFSAYLILFFLPIIIEVREALKWKKLKSRI